jgi:hypothetical protein
VAALPAACSPFPAFFPVVLAGLALGLGKLSGAGAGSGVGGGSARGLRAAASYTGEAGDVGMAPQSSGLATGAGGGADGRAAGAG